MDRVQRVNIRTAEVHDKEGGTDPGLILTTTNQLCVYPLMFKASSPTPLKTLYTMRGMVWVIMLATVVLIPTPVAGGYYHHEYLHENDHGNDAHEAVKQHGKQVAMMTADGTLLRDNQEEEKEERRITDDDILEIQTLMRIQQDLQQRPLRVPPLLVPEPLESQPAAIQYLPLKHAQCSRQVSDPSRAWFLPERQSACFHPSCFEYSPEMLELAKKHHPFGYWYVNDRYKFIYIPIPKVAYGTNEAIALAVGSRMEPISKTEPKKKDEYFIFSFVRDPIGRFVSAYNQVNKLIGHLWNPAHRRFVDKTNRFERLRIFLEEVQNGDLIDEHLLPQSLYLVDPDDGQPLPIDFLTDMKNVNATWNMLSERVRIPSSLLENALSVQKNIGSWQWHGIPLIPGVRPGEAGRLKDTSYLRHRDLSTANREIIMRIYQDDYQCFNMPLEQLNQDDDQRLRKEEEDEEKYNMLRLELIQEADYHHKNNNNNNYGNNDNKKKKENNDINDGYVIFDREQVHDMFSTIFPEHPHPSHHHHHHHPHHHHQHQQQQQHHDDPDMDYSDYSELVDLIASGSGQYPYWWRSSARSAVDTQTKRKKKRRRKKRKRKKKIE